MVEESSVRERRIDLVFAALADATRRRMLVRLRAGRLTISELAGPFEMSFAGVAKHVEVLKAAGLVRKVRAPEDGRVFRLELQNRTLAQATDWLAYHQEFWTQKLNQLEIFVKDQTNAESNSKNRKKNKRRS